MLRNVSSGSTENSDAGSWARTSATLLMSDHSRTWMRRKYGSPPSPASRLMLLSSRRSATTSSSVDVGDR